MKITKSVALRIFLIVELIVFLAFYIGGDNGLLALAELERENVQLKQGVAQLRVEIEDLEMQIVQWDDDPYYKEKIAREQLQMARANEQIIFVD